MSGNWRILLPELSINRVLNPVAMGEGNYSAVGLDTTVVLSTAHSYLGYKSYLVEGSAHNAGITISMLRLDNAIHYITIRTFGAITGWYWSVNAGGTYGVPALLGAEGDWSIYGFQFPAAQCNNSMVLRIYKNGAAAFTWWLGHIQVEQNTYPTTPITGDLKGFCSDGYYWNGMAHASASTRLAKERSGGKEIDLEDTYNFRVRYEQGCGMPPIQHIVQSMALLPGALYQGHKVLPRVLDLVSVTMANTVSTVAASRKNFINAVKPDRVSPDQPTVFRYYGVNANKPVDFYAHYDSGMEFQMTSGIVDQPVARFICYDPFVYETHTESQVLTILQSLANANYIIRKINGVWYNISMNFNNTIIALARGADGFIYIGGNFTNVGNANGDYIVKWDPFSNTLSSLSTGSTGAVYALAAAANGDIYLGGNFLDLGDANGDYISRWDGATFKSLSTGLGNGNCGVLCFGQSGDLYIGGEFTNLVDANGDYITKWDGAVFSSLGTGMNAAVEALASAPNGDIYAAGTFSLAGGVANTSHIARWNHTQWFPLGTGLSGGTPIGYALAIDKAGNVYVGGNFTTADGVACSNIAKWNGKTFEPLGSGLNNTCYWLWLDDKGLLYAGGAFTSAGGISLSDRMAVWNNSTWAHIDANLPGTPIVYAILPDGDNLYVGYNTAGAALTSYLNTVTNNGSTEAYPIIYIHRANDGVTATLEWIKNETTGDTLWCNYSLLPGETLTLDFTPGDRSIISSFFGKVWRVILASSDLSSFRLLPGVNNVSVFVNPVGAPTITAWMEWKITHHSADGAAA